ncbi:hypothetical protein ACEUEG_20910 [Aeromonas media]|uniref:hypothetical protein n=1 Tax=Aeromonas media TaxID=651 RepID=UPI0038D17E2B
MKNHTLFGAITLLFTGGAMAQSPEIAAYYLSGPDAAANTPAYYASLANLETLSQQVASQKSNFNKLVLSFGRCEQVPDMRSCLSSGAMEQGSS